MIEMDELRKKEPLDAQEVEELLHDGIIELSGAKGKRLRFGFMAAIEHEGTLYIVLTKIGGRKQLNHELLLLRLLRNEGRIEDYEVVHDPTEATELIDQYVRLAVQALFEDPAFEEEYGEELSFLEEEESEGVLH